MYNWSVRVKVTYEAQTVSEHDVVITADSRAQVITKVTAMYPEGYTVTILETYYVQEILKYELPTIGGNANG